MARANKLDIKTYNAKRDFTRTKEPRGKTARAGGNSFVVQKHEASRLHWDFRLELGGVLKSWAVPKGPSLDPADKRLAMRTEDHPLDYGDFEGTIPKGEYGGGTVMLWDKGQWVPEPGKDPAKTIEEGHLHFRLEGERMKGDWVLFRLKPRKGEKGEPWMLKKVTDEEADAAHPTLLVDEGTTSVTSGRTMAEIAEGGAEWSAKKDGKGARKKTDKGVPPPAFIAPQLATLVDSVPTGSDWLFEYKYDGYRLLLATGTAAATAWTRNGKDWSDRFKSLVKAASALPADCLIDGEAVALDKDGKPNFGLLQQGLKDGKARLAYYAFDLLVDRGEDIRKLSTIDRKDRLKALLDGSKGPLLYGDHVEAKGQALFDAVCKDKGEGIIAKKADASYRSGRTRHWLKIKCIERQEFVILGWTKSDKARGFRSLLLGVQDGGELTFAGKVGTGFSADRIDELLARMKPLQRKTPAAEVPKAEHKGAAWIEPELVAEVAFTEFTADNVLRHPSFIALRDDKPAKDVVLEKPESLKATAKKKSPASSSARKAGLATAEDVGVAISSPERVVFPSETLTKKDLADYYASIAPLIADDSYGRPITLIRCPQGRAKKCFFQKHDSGGLGDHVLHVPIAEKNGKKQDYLYVEDAKGLLELVQMGTIEFHGWGSRSAKVEYPDRLVFDLDPDEGLDFADVRDAARRVRDLLDDMGLTTFPLLTGGKGIHVVAPLDRSADWEKVKSFAERFSRAIAEAEPKRFTANIRKAQRKGRIFIDWLRNQRGATAVMPYSARAREGAPVAAPVSWDELDDFDGGNAFSIRDAEILHKRATSAPLKDWGKAKQSLPKT